MRPFGHVLLEFVGITLAGTVLALAANGLNSRGVIVTKDYFPRLQSSLKPETAATEPAASRPVESPRLKYDNEYDAAAETLRQEGLQPVDHDTVVAMFNDPLGREGLYVFVDARNDEEYRRGHIPGAFQLDHYLLERYIHDVLPACQQAIKIVTYCNGGDCEDSRFAAIDLIDRGVDPGKIFVYPGGLTEWRECSLPVEHGSRNSGDIVPGNQSGGHP